MPRYQQSPVSRFIDRFLQGLQIYDQFQRTEEIRKRTELEQQQVEEQVRDATAKRQLAQEFYELGKPFLEGQTEKVQIPGATPGEITPELPPQMMGQPPRGYSIAPGEKLSPDLAIPPTEILRRTEPSLRDKTIGAAFMAGKPDIVERVMTGPRVGVSETSQMFDAFKREFQTTNPNTTFDDMAKAWQSYQYNRQGAIAAGGVGGGTAEKLGGFVPRGAASVQAPTAQPPAGEPEPVTGPLSAAPPTVRAPRAPSTSPYLELKGKEKAVEKTAAVQAERKLPLGKKSAEWFHPDSLQAPPGSMSMEEAEKNGFIPSPPNSTNAAESARAFLARLKEYRQYMDLLPKSSGNAYKDRARAAMNWADLKLKFNADPRVTNFMNLGKSTAQAAKAFGDAANISVIEQEQIKDQLPGGAETRESGEAKLDQLEKLIRAAAARGFQGKSRLVPVD